MDNTTEMPDLDDLVKRMFINRVRSLSCIDRHDLPELSVEQWPRFRDAPVHYLLRADDTQTDAIWREVEKRQRRPLNVRSVVAQQAAE